MHLFNQIKLKDHRRQQVSTTCWVFSNQNKHTLVTVKQVAVNKIQGYSKQVTVISQCYSGIVQLSISKIIFRIGSEASEYPKQTHKFYIFIVLVQIALDPFSFSYMQCIQTSNQYKKYYATSTKNIYFLHEINNCSTSS